jgi:hypothetical protein
MAVGLNRFLRGMAMWKALSIAGVMVLAARCAAGEPPDLGKLDRRILKQPAYKAKQPLYGLLVFGPKAEKRVWLVLDPSDPGASTAENLYVDRDADGDLTAADDRLTANSSDRYSIFALPEFKDPATGAIHSDFRVRVEREQHDVMVSLKWRGQLKMGGGYPADPDRYMRLSPDPETAPVVWFQGDGPFRFQRWYGGKPQVGSEEDFKVFLGQIGWGPSSFCAFQEHVLPDGEPVVATLIYSDQAGAEHREVYPLKKRC